MRHLCLNTVIRSAPQFGTPCGKGNEEKEMTDQQVVKDTNDLHHANKQVLLFWLVWFVVQILIKARGRG